MKTGAGLWIDHRKAVVVLVTEGGVETTQIKSEVQPRPYGPQDAQPDDMREAALREHLNAYFDRVISRLRGAGSVLIFGPGEAKGELKKRLDREPSRGRKVSVETADRMTEAQIVAAVRRRFHAPGREPRLLRRGG